MDNLPSIGQRLYLREVRLTDVGERYYSWLNDSEVNRYLETRFIPRSCENIIDYVKRLDGKDNEPFFAICLKKNDLHIGNIKLGPINWYHRTADVSLFIGEKSLWGQGYAAEAISMITDFAFRELNLNKLKAGSYEANRGSIKAFEKSGYQREGLLRSHVISEGKEMDVVLLGILAKEFIGLT